MRPDDAAVADMGAVLDEGERAYYNVFTQHRTGFYNGVLMDHWLTRN